MKAKPGSIPSNISALKPGGGRFGFSALAGAVLAAGAMLVFCNGNAQAANKTWDGGAKGSAGTTDWDEPNKGGNWSGGAPATTDDVFFGSGFTSGTNLNLNGNRTVNSLTINTVTAFNIVNDTLTLTSGSLTRVDVSGTEESHTISSNITLGANGLWTIDGSGALTVSGVVAGTGLTLAKSGSGTLVFSGTAANAYTGLTSVSAGELDLNKTANLGTGGGAIVGALAINGGTVKLLAGNQIGNSATVAISGPGVLNMGAFSDAVAGVQLTGGAITGSGGVLTGNTSAFDLQSGSVSAVLGGSVGLNKTTAGTVTLSGSNTYSGPTNVSAGTLLVSGSLSASSAVTVGPAGTLAGGNNLTSTVGTVAAYGTVAPGNTGGGALSSIGKLKVTGAMTLGASGTTAHLAMEIGGTTAGTGYDQIQVSGALNLTSVNLDGSLVNGFTSSSITQPSGVGTLDGQKFFLVIGASSITGTFANQSGPYSFSSGFNTIAFGGQLFLISYDGVAGTNTFSGGGHDVVLMAVPEVDTWAALIGGVGMLALGRRRRLKK